MTKSLFNHGFWLRSWLTVYSSWIPRKILWTSRTFNNKSTIWNLLQTIRILNHGLKKIRSWIEDSSETIELSFEYLREIIRPVASEKFEFDGCNKNFNVSRFLDFSDNQISDLGNKSSVPLLEYSCTSFELLIENLMGEIKTLKGENKTCLNLERIKINSDFLQY